MVQFLIRRLLLAVVTLFCVTFVIYALIRSMPGDPLMVEMERLDPNKKYNKEDYERMQRAFGLDKPWPVAYVEWLGNTLRFDLGVSLSRKEPVARLIGQKIGPTLMLTIPATVMAYLLSIPLGLYCTIRNRKPDEQVFSTALYMLYSFPTFVAALLLQMTLAVKLEWLPLYGITSDDFKTMSFGGKIIDLMRHAFMPVLCLTYGGLAYEARFIRSNMMEAIRQDYVRTAYAKGCAPRTVIVRHAFRNTLIPLVTLLGLTLPGLLAGAVIIERIFTWPGMGSLFLESIRERDYPTIMGLILMFSVLTLLGQLIADILYAYVDPRVTYS